MISYVIHHAETETAFPDYVMLLEITHPLRPQGIVGQLVESISTRPSDSLVTVHPLHYNFWRRDEFGEISSIQGSGDDPNVGMYQELMGICSIFTPALLETENPFGEQMDMVTIERFWATIDVRDDDGLWLAEQYLKRIKLDTEL